MAGVSYGLDFEGYSHIKNIEGKEKRENQVK
jgi:hypothetical protein